MTIPEHSLLPWTYKEDRCAVIDPNGNLVTIIGHKPDGRLIVTAVNSHAKLLSAAKAVLMADDCDYQAWADLKAAISRAEHA